MTGEFRTPRGRVRIKRCDQLVGVEGRVCGFVFGAQREREFYTTLIAYDDVMPSYSIYNTGSRRCVYRVSSKQPTRFWSVVLHTGNRDSRTNDFPSAVGSYTSRSTLKSQEFKAKRGFKHVSDVTIPHTLC